MPRVQNSSNLADTIINIQQEFLPEAEPKYVNFIDCDGTILYSYTEEEILELTELPPLPTKPGCIYQSWNWTLADIQSYGFPLTVGAARVPSDGDTRLTFELLQGDDLTLSIPFSENTGREYTFDWGDGTTEVYTASPAVHTYAEMGKHVVSMDANETYKLLTLSSTTAIRLVKLEFGARHIYTLDNNLLSHCFMLCEVSIPENIKSFSACSFQYCYSLRSVTMPAGFYELSSGVFNVCHSLQRVSIPKRIATMGTSCFLGCFVLKTLSIPSNTKYDIPSDFLRNCQCIQRIFIPSTVRTIRANAFYDCTRLHHIDLSAMTSVPTLDHASAFYGIASNAVFCVRNAEMLEAFRSADNWSSYAAKMQVGGKYAET